MQVEGITWHGVTLAQPVHRDKKAVSRVSVSRP